MSDKKKERRYPFEDPEVARKAGQKGGRVTAAKTRRKGIALDQLGDLESADDLKRWLQEIAQGVLAGDLDRQDGDVAIRALRAWLDAHGSSLATAELQELRAELDELRTELGPKAA